MRDKHLPNRLRELSIFSFALADRALLGSNVNVKGIVSHPLMEK